MMREKVPSTAPVPSKKIGVSENIAARVYALYDELECSVDLNNIFIYKICYDRKRLF